jgi:pyruvate/2-oxoglutarate dehydrogenase complex dihydrolipoamide acyltransferase (E2) component
VEIQYDTSAWAVYAQEYQRKARALVSPLLPLMAYHLVRLTARHERWNSTIRGDQRVTHGRVNLGFTVQSEDTLYLTVVAGADRLSTAEFVARLAHLQKRALSHSLQADEVTGATVSFSSMARWQVSRHVPVLPPYTSLIIAHAAAVNERGTLGATYDHRVLTGADALEALRALSQPEVFE